MTGGSVAAHRHATRAAIFEAFSALLYDRGYDAITLADIAGEAKMSRTSIYNYFATKDALVVAYTEYEARRFLHDTLTALDAIDNPVDQLRTFISRQLHYFATHHLPPGKALQLVLSTGAYHRVLDHVRELEQVLIGILTTGAEQGYLAITDVDATVPLVMACINRGGPHSFDAAQIADEIDVTETFVLRALGVRLSPDGRPRRSARR